MSGAEDARKCLLRHRQIAAVHELYESEHLVVVDVVEEEHRVLVLVQRRRRRLVEQQRLEQRRTGGQDQLVRADRPVAARQRHVKEEFLLPRLAERFAQFGVMVIPAQRKSCSLRRLHFVSTLA